MLLSRDILITDMISVHNFQTPGASLVSGIDTPTRADLHIYKSVVFFGSLWFAQRTEAEKERGETNKTQMINRADNLFCTNNKPLACVSLKWNEYVLMNRCVFQGLRVTAKQTFPMSFDSQNYKSKRSLCQFVLLECSVSSLALGCSVFLLTGLWYLSSLSLITNTDGAEQMLLGMYHVLHLQIKKTRNQLQIAGVRWGPECFYEVRRTFTFY